MLRVRITHWQLEATRGAPIVADVRVRPVASLARHGAARRGTARLVCEARIVSYTGELCS